MSTDAFVRAGPPAQRRGAEGVRLELLDGFRLRHDGRDLFLRPSDQRLIALLAVRGAAQRVLVAGTLWSGVTDEHALGSLRTALWRLRRLPPPLVSAHGELVRLHPCVSTDLGRLVPAIDRVMRGDDEPLEQLLQLRGDLLPGWYDDWVLVERARLRQLWMSAAEVGAARRLSTGDHLVALSAALATVGADPWRESAHRLLIEVHRAEGNNQAAIRQLQMCRDLLADQGVPPSDQLRLLSHTMRAAASRS